ncbi:DUF4365 domain-containing protein [Citromicrobium sp. JLT1363]|uniref:DUF4365 domain-containing protein n=1 Tax=Citromicrobium sp. JLT1363 TaxID=517722 RepID=UPI0004909F98|nr:DUF4365 domain-containing protein [Citromicrobium sp. JLT1363]
MSSAKKQSEQHLIDRAGQELLKSKLPKHWVLREYRPDYGLDFALEIFSEGEETGKSKTYETLGEHLFIQLKTVEKPNTSELKVYSRGNVEKAPESLDKKELVCILDTYAFSLEVSELATVERMGVGVPVLLVLADLENERCSFVCLNDYVDKILIPKHADYRSAGRRTIHVPWRNEIGTETGLIALRWYAKRPKLFAAFQRFVYQYAELGWAQTEDELEELSRYFARRIANYDFWDDVDMWIPIKWWGDRVKKFNQTGEIELFGAHVPAEDRGGDWVTVPRPQHIMELWRVLALLPRTYEDICREWFLPTSLGEHASAPPSEED